MHTDLYGGAEPVHQLDGNHERPSLSWQETLPAGDSAVAEDIDSARETALARRMTARETALARRMRLGQRPVDGHNECQR